MELIDRMVLASRDYADEIPEQIDSTLPLGQAVAQVVAEWTHSFIEDLYEPVIELTSEDAYLVQVVPECWVGSGEDLPEVHRIRLADLLEPEEYSAGGRKKMATILRDLAARFEAYEGE